MQSVLRALYPPQCVSCGGAVESEFGLCGPCWRQTPFIAGHICDLCGCPLPGEGHGNVDHCDDCMTIARPWARGRAATLYRDNARKFILALKHGDRLDLARPAANWMIQAGADVLLPETVIVPIPSHWTRLFYRRYNQAAVLAKAIAVAARREFLPNLLIRERRTETQDGKGRDARFASLQGAIRPHPKRGKALHGRNVLLIDDVMTSGATFSAATEACHAAGARRVCILTLARVAKDT